jgi:hypothetical protein
MILLRSLAAGLAALGVAAAGDLHALDEDLGGPPSPYARALLGVLRDGRPAPAETAAPSPLQLTCVATPGDARYVGIVQRMWIAAPLSTVEGILDDVPHYKDLFPDLVNVRIVPGSRTGNRYVVAWEQRVPVFFLPNSRYELTYLVGRSEGRVVYRYRLLRGRDLINSDGIITLDEVGPGITRFTEYDFFNARWGVLPESMVWRDSLRGVFLSDVAIKLKAENPTWSYPRIAAEADRLRRQEEGALRQCRGARQPASSVLAL